MELVGYEDVEAGSHEALASLVVHDACEQLHEDALESISYDDMKELQNFLDEWCAKQTGTRTLYPCYKEYVKVQKEWFD